MMPLQSLAKILKGRADPGGGQDYGSGPIMTSSPQIIITRFSEPEPEPIEKTGRPEIVLSENLETSHNDDVDFNCDASLAENDVSDATTTNDENVSVRIEVPRFNNQLQVRRSHNLFLRISYSRYIRNLSARYVPL